MSSTTAFCRLLHGGLHHAFHLAPDVVEHRRGVHRVEQLVDRSLAGRRIGGPGGREAKQAEGQQGQDALHGRTPGDGRAVRRSGSRASRPGRGNPAPRRPAFNGTNPASLHLTDSMAGALVRTGSRGMAMPPSVIEIQGVFQTASSPAGHWFARWQREWVFNECVSGVRPLDAGDNFRGGIGDRSCARFSRPLSSVGQRGPGASGTPRRRRHPLKFRFDCWRPRSPLQPGPSAATDANTARR